MNREKLRGGCGVPNVDSVLDLLQRFGVWGLGGCDGCECAHFSVLGISVDVSCRKSEHCIRVHSGYLGFDRSRLVPIAREVLSQLSYPQPYTVRFCDYSYDHKNGRRENGVWVKDQVCCYCGKTRPDAVAYLCADCIEQAKGVDLFPLNLDQLAQSLLFELVPADELS